jgi:hypothetical protein
MELFEPLRDWWRRHEAVQELDVLGGDIVAELARDNAVRESDLYNLTARKPAGAELLPRLLTCVGLDSEELHRGKPGIMRDMVVICSGCIMARRCRHELNRQHTEPDYRQYCANSQTIDTLRKDQSAFTD